MDGVRVQLQWKGGSSMHEDDKKLIGRVISDTKIGVGAVKDQVMAAWKPKNRLDVNLLGFNLFSFSFENPLEAKKVLEESPWVIRQHMLSLERRKPFLCDSEVQIKSCGMWVQFHDIPPEGMMAVNIRDMAEKIGRVVEVEDPRDERFLNRRFGRARVEIDTDKPLVAIFKVPRPDDLPEAKVKVRYEKLAKFCFTCGRLGHDERACEMDDDDDPSIDPRRMFDASMCAPPYRVSATPAARGNSHQQSNQNRSQKERGENSGTSGASKGKEMVQGMGMEVRRHREIRELRGVGNDMLKNEMVLGGGKGEVILAWDPQHQEAVQNAFLNEEKRKIVGEQVFGPMEGVIRPMGKKMELKFGFSSNPGGLEIYGPCDNENRKKETRDGSQNNEQQAQVVVRNEAVVGDLVNQVERVHLKRGADQEWTSPSSKRRKVHEQDSPGKSSRRQQIEEQIDKWSEVDFKDGGLGFSIESKGARGKISSEFFQIDVEEEVTFVEGKGYGKVSRYKYKGNKTKRALFVENETSGVFRRHGGWPNAATKGL